MAIANQNGNGTLRGGPITIQADPENVVKQFLARGKVNPHWRIEEADAISFKCNPLCIEQIITIVKETYHCGYRIYPEDAGLVTVRIYAKTFRFE